MSRYKAYPVRTQAVGSNNLHNEYRLMIQELRHLRAVLATLFALMFGAACADTTMPAESRSMTQVHGTEASGDYLLPPVTVTVPQCDPYTDLNWCQESGGGGGDCMTSTAAGDGLTLSSCGGSGGGSSGGGGGGGGTTTFPPTIDEGPGAFAACVGTLLVVLGTTATMEPLAHDLYAARNDYHSAQRMFDAVMANNPSLEMELLYAHRLEVAKNGYDGAVRGYAAGAGASVLAVAAAVVACSPGLLLPTP